MALMCENYIAGKRADFLRDAFADVGDAARCLGSLTKLERHFEEPVTITGSIAARWHLIDKGRLNQNKRLNDIDVVVGGVRDLRPSLGADFLINHFHPSRGPGRILVQLVDEEHRTRIDVFTANTQTLAGRLTDAAMGGLACKVVASEDLCAKLLSVICAVMKDEPVESKYVEHFRLLSAVLDSATARKVWAEYRRENQPEVFDEAAAAVMRKIAASPDLLRTSAYSQDVSEACRWCHESESFPLAPKLKVYETLGYV